MEDRNKRSASQVALEESKISNVPEDQRTESPEELKKKRREKIFRWVKMISFLVIIIGLIVFIIVESGRVSSWLESFLTWVEENEVLGMFIFVIVYILATVLFVPGLILTLGAGFIYAGLLSKSNNIS